MLGTLFSVFMSVFLRSKIAARRLDHETAAPADKLQASGALFCSSSSSLRKRSTSEDQSVANVVPLSHKVDGIDDRPLRGLCTFISTITRWPSPDVASISTFFPAGFESLQPAHSRSYSRVRWVSLWIERFRDFHFTDRITYRQSVKLIRNLEFRASFAQLYVYV